MKLALKVIPNAKKSEAVGWEEDPRAGRALKLRIAAPPVEGKANEACIELLAELLGVKRAQVTIIAGLASRTKTIAVKGARATDIAARIAALQNCKF